ncbi:hypothetical protein R6Q59_025070 [Mikania micrantha]
MILWHTRTFDLTLLAQDNDSGRSPCNATKSTRPQSRSCSFQHILQFIPVRNMEMGSIAFLAVGTMSPVTSFLTPAHWVGVKLRKQSLASSEKLHRKRFHSHSRKAGVYPVEEAHSIVESFFTNEPVDGWIVKPISLLENLNQVRPTRFWGVYTRLKIFNMTNYEKLIPNSFLGTFMKGSDWL